MLKKLLSLRLLLVFLCFWTPVYATRENNESNCRYKLSIAALFQNETFFMKEWIEYHRMVGVEHFLLYNNNSTDNWQAILAPYIKEGLVEVLDWTDSYYLKKEGKKTQRLVYEDAITRLIGVSQWVAIIDLDEFLFPKTYATVTELLEKHFASFDAVCVNWRNFGTSYRTLAADDSILCSLVNTSVIQHPRNRFVKSIVRPEAIDWEKSSSIHWYVLKKGYTCADGYGCEFYYNKKTAKGKEKTRTGLIQLNHYRFGDEWYWHSVKSPRLIERFGTSKEYKKVLTECEDNNMTEDSYPIADFIKAYHPKEYALLWKDGKFKRDFYHA